MSTLHTLRPRGLATLVAPGLLLASSFAFGQEPAQDLAQAFTDGKFNVSFRYRFENVDEEPFTEEAYASTLRSRLTFTTAPYKGFSGLLEMDDLRSVGDDNYNSTRNGETLRPVVADPEATDLNQMALRFNGFDNTEIVVGRQRILRGNERFVGPVGWRQNEQTMDSASIGYKAGEKLQAWYAYVSQVNRIYGPDAGTPPADLTGNTHLADVSYAFGPAAKLTAYGYFLDFEEALSSSSQSLGVRLAGDIRLGDEWAVPYAVEYATQEDYGDNPADYDAEYYLAEAGVRWQKLTAKLAYEVLGGGSDGAFQTPLATGHAFQGWADKFLTTPADGIEDAFLVVEYAASVANLKVRYDTYQTESGGSADYGDELGLWLTVPIGKNYSASLKYATFSADSDAPAGAPRDTDKLWVMLTAAF